MGRLIFIPTGDPKKDIQTLSKMAKDNLKMIVIIYSAFLFLILSVGVMLIFLSV